MIALSVPMRESPSSLASDSSVKQKLYLIGRGETPRAQAASKAIRARFARPGEKEKQSQMQKRLWEDETHREHMVLTRRKIVKQSRYRARMHKAAWENQDVRNIQKRKARKRWKTPSYRQAIVAAVKAKWQDPEYRERQLANLERARAAKRRGLS